MAPLKGKVRRNGKQGAFGQSYVVSASMHSLLWMFGVLISLIGLRVFLKLIGANPANFFAQFVYSFTDIFLWPFFGLTGNPSANGMVLEIPSIIAMVVYAIIAWVIAKLAWLLFFRS